ncbi:MAG TPA: L,D-transpeptidase, partial [Labilithrix sp.]|nr:L,D-transpeptidase [Labilithrix sp.]
GTRPWIGPAGEDGSPNVDFGRLTRPGAGTSLPPIEPLSASDDGLPYRYFFAGRDGAFGFANLATALDDSPDQELEPGFAVSILEEKSAHGERWVKTKKGRWVAMRELVPARPNLFHGELVQDDKLDMAWVVADKANVFSSEKTDKASGTRVRFEKVHVYEEKPVKGGAIVRISAESEPASWMRARDLARPRLAEPPPEVAAEDAAERWIDVDLPSQTLVAYVGKRPVFATIVSTGKGPVGSDFVTRAGTFRIWVKVFTTKMDNLDSQDRGALVDHHYAIEDVPWVQFFDKAIGLHGAFWHRDFGRVHSHGCVNMAPLDARWVFAFTTPHLPLGWTAVLPSKVEQGAVVRVH